MIIGWERKMRPDTIDCSSQVKIGVGCYIIFSKSCLSSAAAVLGRIGREGLTLESERHKRFVLVIVGVLHG